MAAPNIIGATTINGKTTGVDLPTTNETTVLNNPASSGKCLKINTLNVANYSSTTANITINFHTASNIGGTAIPIIGNISVPGNATLNVVDKTSQYYLEENTSIGAVASLSSKFAVTVSYEEIS